MDGLLVVVSGFSGVGKGTLMKELLKRYPNQYSLSVSATSRAPRTGEVDGKEYFFKSREEFEKMIQNGELLEYTEYNGNYYGTPKAYVEEELKSGHNVILEIEIQGGFQVKSHFPQCYLLYVIPPTAKSLYERLLTRGTESQEDIIKRMNLAIRESNYITDYDCVVVNDDFEDCLSEIHESIKNRQRILKRTNDYKEQMISELTDLMKGE